MLLLTSINGVKVMNWQELRKEAYNLPVHERLLLLEAIAYSPSKNSDPETPT